MSSFTTIHDRRAQQPPAGSASVTLFVISFLVGIFCIVMADNAQGYDSIPWLLAALCGGVLYVIGFIAGIVAAFRTRPVPTRARVGIIANGLLLPFIGPVWWFFLALFATGAL